MLETNRANQKSFLFQSQGDSEFGTNRLVWVGGLLVTLAVVIQIMGVAFVLWLFPSSSLGSGGIFPAALYVLEAIWVTLVVVGIALAATGIAR